MTRLLRIHLVSDLHLEWLADTPHAGTLPVPYLPDADLLVLAGDIDTGTRVVQRFAQWPCPVLCVIGNHESYGIDLVRLRESLKAEARGTSVVVLDNDLVDWSRFPAWHEARADTLARVRFLGCTLWTDYRYRCELNREQLMRNAELRIADHQRIMYDGRPFRAADALREHEKSRCWLAEELRRPFAGTTVVLTHHAPHILSIHPRFAGDPTNAAFASNLSELLPLADYWLHGHMHDGCDYRFGRCRVVCNPRGYPMNARASADASDLAFENASFNPSLILEISALSSD